jgi:hypothetical protein
MLGRWVEEVGLPTWREEMDDLREGGIELGMMVQERFAQQLDY